MADQSVRGRFVWHELVTPDSNAAHTFYAKAIGWKSQPWEEDSSYVMFAAPRGPIGATVTRNGAAPHWLPYIGTGDLDQTVELAKQKGGSVVMDVNTMSSGSRYAVLQDPYGATFGVYESAEDYGKITPPKPGEHSWHELMSTDHQGAFDFYAALFGWEKQVEHDMGEMGTYLIYGIGDVPFGGMMNVMEGGPGPAWVSYVHVKDVNQTAKKVKSGGGKVINGPMEVPGGDWIVQAVDPQGAMFAAHATAADMKMSGKKPEKKSRQKLSAAESPPPVVEEPETPATEQAPPAEKPPEQKAPAKKAPARKAPAKEAPATDTTEEAPAKQAPAKKSPAKKAPAKKKAPGKKKPSKKAPAKKSTKTPARKSGKKSAKKKAGKRPAAKGAGSKKSSAKSAKKSAKAKSKSKQTRSGGKKKAGNKPRKGK